MSILSEHTKTLAEVAQLREEVTKLVTQDGPLITKGQLSLINKLSWIESAPWPRAPPSAGPSRESANPISKNPERGLQVDWLNSLWDNTFLAVAERQRTRGPGPDARLRPHSRRAYSADPARHRRFTKRHVADLKQHITAEHAAVHAKLGTMSSAIAKIFLTTSHPRRRVYW